MAISRAVLVRVVIYGSLVAYFGSQAVQTWWARRQASGENLVDPHREELDQTKRSVTLPDGTKQDVYYVSPEQAERFFGVKAKPREATGSTEGADQANGPEGSLAPPAADPSRAPLPATPR